MRSLSELSGPHHTAAFQDIVPQEPAPPARRLPAPLLPIAIGIIIGVEIDNIFPSLWISVAFLSISLCLFAVRGQKLGTVAVLIAGLATGGLRHAISDRWVPSNDIGLFCEETPSLVLIHGVVVEEPRINPRDPAGNGHSKTAGRAPTPHTRFLLAAREIRGTAGPIPVQGLIFANVKAAVPALHEGDRVAMTGWLHRPMSPRNPGEYDWRLHFHRAGIDAAFSCEHAESVIIEASRPPSILTRLRNHLRGYLIDPMPDAQGQDGQDGVDASDDSRQGDSAGGILSAMVLGRRNEVSQTVNEAFIRTGNSHFLAASGTNVGWLAMFGWWILMRLAGLHYRKVIVIIAALIVLFLAVSEPQPSILRAAIIGLLGCWAIFVGGRRNLDNALACSAIIILMIDPNDLFRPAFQFSYLAVIAISKLEPVMAGAVGRFCMRRNWFWLADQFDPQLYQLTLFDLSSGALTFPRFGLISAIFSPRMITMSISAWLITLPLTCYHFNQFTPWGWFGTLALWFLIVPLTFIGFLAILCGLIFPPSHALFSPILAAGTYATLWLVNMLAKVPYTLLPGRNPSLAWVGACYALLAWIMFRSTRKGKSRIENGETKTSNCMGSFSTFSILHSQFHQHRFGIVALFLVLWWLIPPRWINGSRNALNVWMLAVGGGTGTVIELPNGKVIMYDLGTRSDFDVGRTASSFLSWRGITAIDAIFVSHTDSDHLSGITTLAKTIPIGRVIVSDHFESMAANHEVARNLLTTLRASGIPVEISQCPQEWQFDPDVRAGSLWPPPRAQLRFVEANATSTVLRIDYESRSILLPGDIESEAEALLLKNSAERLHADVLALPHHGSVTPFTGKFIKAVNPRFIIRSSGQGERMTTNGISKLTKDSKYYNTADDGCVHVEIRGKELRVSSFLNRSQTEPL
jgi:competence protein ComEC